jgi:hypothetical protein
MLILAKAALGLGAVVAMAGVYVMHEGVIHVDVDEHRDGGSHIHLWVPATAVSVGMHIASKKDIRKASEGVRPYLPAIREVAKELNKYPNVEFVNVISEQNHVRVGMVDGELRIDAVSEDGDVVHVTAPARVLEDVADGLEENAPGV